MARTAIKVDRKRLAASIKTISEKSEYDGIVDFWQKVADDYGGKVSVATLKGRVKTFGIEVDIQRKRVDNTNDMAKVRKSVDHSKPRKRRKANPRNIEAIKARLTDHQQLSLMPLVEKIENGNVKSAIKLFCISCCGYSKKEVSLCTAIACPLHSLRPYQKGEESEE